MLKTYKLKNFKFKIYFLTIVFALTSLLASNQLYSLNQRKEPVFEQWQSSYEIKIQNIKQELSQHNIQQAKEDIAELTKLTEKTKLELINEFIQNQENKFYHNILPSIQDGYMEATNHLKGQILLSILGIIPGTFKGEFFNRIESFNEQIKKAFSIEIYRNLKFFPMFASQLTIKNLPVILKLVASISLNIYSIKFLGIPYSTFSMAMAPLHGIIGTTKSFLRRYKEKKMLKNNILQKFKIVNTLLTQLKNLSEATE